MKKIKVGIVDDNKDFCDVVSDYLKKQDNIELLFVANDGVKATEYLGSGAEIPDVLVLDLIMPHLDGFGVLEALNTIPSEISESYNDVCGGTRFHNPESYGNGSAVLSG